MVSFTISISSEGLTASLHPTPTSTASIYSSHSHSHSHSRSNSHSISISNRSASPPPRAPPPPYYQKYQHPHQQLQYRSQHQSHRPYSHNRYAFISGPSSSTRGHNDSTEGLEQLLPFPSRSLSTARGRERTNKPVRAQPLISSQHNNSKISNTGHKERRMIWKRHSTASDGSPQGMDPAEAEVVPERRMSFGRGGAGNIRRPSVVPFAVPTTEDSAANATGSSRRRSSVWSAIHTIAPGSSPDGKSTAAAGGGGILSFFTRRKRDASASGGGD